MNRFTNLALAASLGTMLAAGHALAAVIPVDDADDLQAAIDGATAGDTIIVGPGTYDPIVMDKQLTLLGAKAGMDACGRDDASESVIADTGTLIELRNGSAGSVIDGFELSGGTAQLVSTSGPIDDVQILNNRFVGFSGGGIFLNDSGEDITIDQNLIDGTSKTGGGGILHLDTDPFDGMHITNNCVSNGATGTGLFSDGNRNVGVSATRAPLLSGNVFDGNDTGANLGSRSFETAVISGNTFSNNAFDGLQGGMKDSTIIVNSFIGNGRSGLALTSFGNTNAARGAQNNAISQNCFQNNGFVNDGEGVFFSSGQAAGTISTNRLNGNNISGNNVGASYGGTESPSGDFMKDCRVVVA
ncbi:MAG TPA: right-handed parallel beta-helix repeat-containing protein [Acidiferrobacterales bacterium]